MTADIYCDKPAQVKLFGGRDGKASVITDVKTIYPTLTHPIHATIISGAAAGKTGIPNNLIFNREDPTRAPKRDLSRSL